MTLAYSLNYCLYLSVIYTYFHMGDILSTWAWSSSLFNYLYHHYVPIFNKHESVLIKGYYLKWVGKKVSLIKNWYFSIAWSRWLCPCLLTIVSDLWTHFSQKEKSWSSFDPPLSVWMWPGRIANSEWNGCVLYICVAMIRGYTCISHGAR